MPSRQEIAGMIRPIINDRFKQGVTEIKTTEIFVELRTKDPMILKNWDPGHIKSVDGIKKAIGDTLNWMNILSVAKGVYRLTKEYS